jgi:hypothetical protein
MSVQGELPREVVISIQGILPSTDTDDPLDALVDFNPVKAINGLFEDGAYFVFVFPLGRVADTRGKGRGITWRNRDGAGETRERPAGDSRRD